MYRRSALLLVTFGLLNAAAAQAQEQTSEPRNHISLRWDAPNECPDDAQLVGAVEGLLGQPLSEAREQELAVSVNVQASADGFSAKLEFASPQGTQERFLDHPDCRKLMEAAALLAALAIDPERVRARQEAGDAIDSAPASAAVPLPEAKPNPPTAQQVCPVAPPPRVAPAISPLRRVSLGLAAFVGGGVLPGVNAGLAAEAGARFDRLHVRLLGRYWLPGSVDIQGGPLSIELSLATVGLHGCVVPRHDQWSILGCFGLNLGDMSGSGQGVNHAHTRHAVFGALEASVLAAYSHVEPAPFVGLGFSWAVLRPPFGASLAGVETEAFTPGQPAVLAFFGVSYGL
ncbi:MAG: hypothetical protein ABUL60_34800 [Myxococcales bacterium]